MRPERVHFTSDKGSYFVQEFEHRFWPTIPWLKQPALQKIAVAHRIDQIDLSYDRRERLVNLLTGLTFMNLQAESNRRLAIIWAMVCSAVVVQPFMTIWLALRLASTHYFGLFWLVAPVITLGSLWILSAIFHLVLRLWTKTEELDRRILRRIAVQYEQRSKDLADDLNVLLGLDRPTTSLYGDKLMTLVPELGRFRSHRPAIAQR